MLIDEAIGVLSGTPDGGVPSVYLFGDATPHGGWVNSAQFRHQTSGKPVAFHGCHTSCGTEWISASRTQYSLER